jgi:hypothetical protein
MGCGRDGLLYQVVDTGCLVGRAELLQCWHCCVWETYQHPVPEQLTLATRSLGTPDQVICGLGVSVLCNDALAVLRRGLDYSEEADLVVTQGTEASS